MNPNPANADFLLEVSTVRFWLLSGGKEEKVWIEVLVSKTSLPVVQSEATRVESKILKVILRYLLLLKIIPGIFPNIEPTRFKQIRDGQSAGTCCKAL